MEIVAVYQPDNTQPSVDFAAAIWQPAVAHSINRDWQGRSAPTELGTTARILWTKTDIHFGYECHFTELDIDLEFDLTKERHALWDRDVCEAFVRSPLEPDPRIYKEFEVAPTGQWVDLQINRIDMIHDWEWKSGMTTRAEIDPVKQIWRAVMSIPFSAFGLHPEAGDVWAGNLFRISRLNGQRQFLAYSPTLTEKPSFHHPEHFIDLRFSG